jgi:hypothetical protein
MKEPQLYKKSRLLKFCFVPATSARSSRGFLQQPPTVLTRQKWQVIHAINQSIFNMMFMTPSLLWKGLPTLRSAKTYFFLIFVASYS